MRAGHGLYRPARECVVWWGRGWIRGARVQGVGSARVTLRSPGRRRGHHSGVDLLNIRTASVR